MRSASNSATIARTLNSSRPPGSAGSWIELPEVELDLSGGELIDDVTGVWQRAGEAIELGDDEGVAVPARRERFAESGALAGGAGEAVVDVDAFGRDAEPGEAVALGGEVLLVGGDSSVADQQAGHPRECPI